MNRRLPDEIQKLHCAFVAGPDSLDISHIAINFYNRRQLKYEPVLITPAKSLELLNSTYYFNCKVIVDEDLPGYYLVKKWLESNLKYFERTGRSSNWYIQQFVKLAYASGRDGMTFIHDGDTVFSPTLLSKFNSAPLLLTTRENPTLYNEGCRQLEIPLKTNVSFVANGGLFDLSLIQLSKQKTIEDWFISAIESTVFNSSGSDFSEYQIMGHLANINYSWCKYKVKFFRRFDLIASVDSIKSNESAILKALSYYDAISFERNHNVNLFRKIIAHFLYWNHFTW